MGCDQMRMVYGCGQPRQGQLREARRRHCWRRVSLSVVEGSWDRGGPELELCIEGH